MKFLATFAGVGALAWLCGCALVENQWVEDGPAARQAWESPSAIEIAAQHEPSPDRNRGWASRTIRPQDGAVEHWPTYFEDPFVDKGAGRDEPNVYHLGWEDYVALGYNYPRFTLNWLMLPISAIVTPPWTIMVSDGRVSRQALGYDHDAARASEETAVPLQHDEQPSKEPDVDPKPE